MLLSRPVGCTSPLVSMRPRTKQDGATSSSTSKARETEREGGAVPEERTSRKVFFTTKTSSEELSWAGDAARRSEPRVCLGRNPGKAGGSEACGGVGGSSACETSSDCSGELGRSSGPASLPSPWCVGAVLGPAGFFHRRLVHSARGPPLHVPCCAGVPVTRYFRRRIFENKTRTRCLSPSMFSLRIYGRNVAIDCEKNRTTKCLPGRYNGALDPQFGTPVDCGIGSATSFAR